MAILSRPKISPQQRFDLEDWEALLSSLRSDSKLYTKQFLSNQNLILKGFAVSGIGLKEALVAMADASLILPAGNFDFSYFISAPAEPNITVPDADLTDGARNYLEIQLQTEDGVPLTKAFWDPDANGGDGLEFNQVVNTITDLKVGITTSTGGFTGSADTLPLAIIDVDGSGNITGIFDRRELFFRLAKPNDLDNEYSWGTRQEPLYSLALSGASGSFLNGEPVTINGETATVVTGGAVSITINEPSGINFQAGDTITGGISGETATISTILESFTGVDKSIGDFKESINAIMTEIKGLKGTRFWWDGGYGSISGIQNLISSRIVDNPSAFGPYIKWDGSNVQITDDAATPADADVLAYLRVFNSTSNLSLTRQDDGEEVQKIAFSAEPDAGSFTIDFNGDVSNPINYDDDAAAVQAAWDAQIAESVTISGDFKDGFLIRFNTVGDKVAVIEGSNSLEQNAIAVTTTITEERKGQASDQSIAVADQEILYIKKPASGNRTYDGVGSGDSNYQVIALGSYVNNDENYWIAYREGAKLYLRNGETLSTGEATKISGGDVPAALLAILGLTSQNTPPTYLSNIRGEQGESFVKRMSTNTDAIGDSQEDRSAFLRSDDLITWTGTELQFTQDIVLEILNTKTGTVTSHTVDVSNSPLSIADGESLYVKVDRDISETLTIINSGVTAIPAQSQDNKDIFVLFTRIDTGAGVQVLHIPFHKQALDPGQAVRLGASGSGGSGDSNSFTETLKNRLLDSTYEYVTPVISATDKEDGLDAASTASYDAASGDYLFDTIGQTVVTNQMLDPEFLTEERNVNQIEVIALWNSDAQDNSATYEASRNGGNEYQSITMERVGLTDTFRGTLEFAAEASDQTILSQLTTGSNRELTDSGAQALAQEITIANATVLRELDLYVTKNGTPDGQVTVKIIRDDSSFPSLDINDVALSSNLINISDLSTGLNTIVLPETIIAAGTYHIVVETSQAYKDSYVASTTSLELQHAAAGTGFAQYNGTSWGNITNAQLAYALRGIELDLRVRVTSVTDDVQLKALGVFYAQPIGVISSQQKNREVFHFQAVADNDNSFTLTSFVPDPDLLTVYYIQAGQVYKNGAFNIQGQTIVFEVDQFNNGGVEAPVTLVFEQGVGSSYDNSDLNALLLAANHLGSTDGSIDQSSAGRGIYLRAPNGTLKEVSIGNDDRIEIDGNAVDKKTQVKYLTSDINADGVMSDITFNNLTVNDWYRISGNFLYERDVAGRDVWAVLIDNGVTRLSKSEAHAEDAGSRITDHFFIEFKATATTVTFTADGVSSTESYIRGNNSKDETWAQLTEIDPLEETTDFS